MGVLNSYTMSPSTRNILRGSNFLSDKLFGNLPQWDSREMAYIEFRNFIHIYQLDIFRDIIWPKEKVLRSILSFLEADLCRINKFYKSSLINLEHCYCSNTFVFGIFF